MTVEAATSMGEVVGRSSGSRSKIAVSLAMVLVLALAVSITSASLTRSDRPLRDRWLDAWLTTKISTQYIVDADVSSRDIRVDSFDRQVTLSGPVTSSEARWQAVAIARSTDGVRDVVDRLWIPQEVKADLAGMRRDEFIITNVRAAYFNDPELKHESISVASADGHVVLAGAVATTAQRHRAKELARGIKGVASVAADNLVVIARIPQAKAHGLVDETRGRGSR